MSVSIVIPVHPSWKQAEIKSVPVSILPCSLGPYCRLFQVCIKNEALKESWIEEEFQEFRDSMEMEESSRYWGRISTLCPPCYIIILFKTCIQSRFEISCFEIS